MIADIANGWSVVVAVVLAVPATVAAVLGTLNRRELATSNGGTLGERVESLAGDVAELKDAALQNRTAILWLQQELTGHAAPDSVEYD